MIVKSVWVSDKNIEAAKFILNEGVEKLERLNNQELNSKFNVFDEIDAFIASDFVKSNAKYIPQLLSFGLFINTSKESIEPIFSESPSVIFNSGLTSDVNKMKEYVSEKRLNSLMNSSSGSLCVRLAVRKDVLEELQLSSANLSIEALSDVVLRYIAPYWLFWNSLSELTVCQESKPGMTTGDIARIFMELGMVYMGAETEDLLLLEDVSFMSVECSADFKTSVQKEWDITADAMKCLHNDDFLRLSQLLKSGLSPNVDFPHNNTLINIAFNSNAHNCIDVLLENGASLWKVTVGEPSVREYYESSFLQMVSGRKLNKFAEFQFYMGYLKREAKKARDGGKPIPYLVEKSDMILFNLILCHNLNREFMENWAIGHFKEILSEDEYNKVVVSVCARFPSMISYFKEALAKINKGDLLEIIFYNRSNLKMIHNIVKFRKIKAQDIIFKGKNFKQLLKDFSYDDDEILYKTLSLIE